MSGDGRPMAIFLRGINLGGRRIANADLCAAFATFGLGDARAFRAAGNVVAVSAEPESALVERIEMGLEKELGYEVRAFVRDGTELEAIASFEPFPAAELVASKGKPQVCLLAEPLTPNQREEILSRSTVDDRLVPGEREIHWLPAGGVSESALDWDRLVPDGGLQTMRTMGTIEGILRKFFA